MTSEPSRGSPPLPAIPGYRVLRLLGAGGMGRVYLAEDEALGRSVAVKVVAERFEGAPDARARFLREARAMATVEHPAVVRIYSYGEREGAVYFVMEYVEGEPLSERLLRGRLPLDAALQLLGQTTDALEAAFEKGVVHRDIKPGNILLDRKGRAHVADFGLAKPLHSASDPSLTDTGAILGTPYYVSPEQARGLPVDFRSDIYSLGIVAFEALAGDRPFVGTTSFEVVAKHIHQPLPDLRRQRPDVPEGVVRAVEWMTAKDPAARPPSYAALRQALGIAGGVDALASSPTATRLPEVAPTLQPPAARRWRRVLAGAAAALALAGALLWSRRGVPERAADDKQLVVAVAPFYGLDGESAKEGRLMAALVEREVVRRLGTQGVSVKGVDETKQPVRDHAAARALGERLGASVVVWGDAFALGGETEIQPSFTLVPRPARDADESRGMRTALGGGDPSDVLRAMAAPARATPAASPIDLRRTSAAGVGDLVMVLAGMHTLYNENDAEKALSLFERAPKSAQGLRHRAEALLRLRRPDTAMAALKEAIALDPADASAHAALGDLLIESDRLVEAEQELRRAAELGGRYATRNGIVFEDKLYLRETFREWREPGRGQRLDSGYLIAVDAASGRVFERHRLPGVMQFSLSVGDGVLRISYADPRSGTAAFAKGRFEKPLFYGSHLRLRRLAGTAGGALAANFLDGYAWRKNPDAKLAPSAPATLPELEARLRDAAERDPTQPWHLVFLGQAQKAQGRAHEAQQTWSALFAGAFPGTTYFEYSHMARLFETWGERASADRAYSEALARRELVPQPIEACFIIERLISATFIQGVPEWRARDADLERIHVWVERVRELSGTSVEGDDLIAAAWSGYFRRKGDHARAAREQQLALKASRHLAAGERYSAAFDIATQVYLSLSFAAWAFLLIAAPPWPRRVGWRAAVAALSPRHRRIVLGSCVLALVSFTWLARSGLDLRGVWDITLGLMDSLGSAENVNELERRLALVDTPRLRFAAAVANHMAGNLERARELYRPLERDDRVRSNINALRAGISTPREPLTAADFVQAHQERPWSDWLGRAWRVQEIVAAWTGRSHLVLSLLLVFGRFLSMFILALAAGLFAFVPPSPASDHARAAPSLLLKALPGVIDVRRGAALRGYITLCLLSFSLVVAVTQLSSSRTVPSAGILSSWAVPLKGLPWPLPANTPMATDEDAVSAVRSFYWDFLRARPHVAALWAAAFLAFAGALFLHVQTVRGLQNTKARPSLPMT